MWRGDRLYPSYVAPTGLAIDHSNLHASVKSSLSATSACVIFQEWLTSIHMLVGTYTRMLASCAIASVCTQAIATSYAPHHLLCIVTLYMLYI